VTKKGRFLPFFEYCKQLTSRLFYRVISMTESHNNQTFNFMVLWQALLNHHYDAAIALCEGQLHSDKPVTITTLVNTLKEPTSIAESLSSLAEEEASAQGWQALFFGIARLAVGQLDRAFSLFETAAEAEISRAPALVYLAALYLAKNQVDMVEESIREGLSLNKELGEFHLLKARLILLQVSIQSANRSINNNADQRQEHNNNITAQLFSQAHDELVTAQQKGNCSQLNLARYSLELLLAKNAQQEAVEQAVTFLEQGIAGVSQNEIASIGLNVLISCGALDEANNYLEQALEATPNCVELLIFRADIASLNGRFRVAAAAIFRALKQDENNIELLHKKAGLTGQGFSYLDGLAALDQLIELTQALPAANRAVYLAIYGDIYFEQEVHDKSLAAYQFALTVDEQCMPALAGSSQVLTSLGRMDEAKAAQDKVYAIAPLRAMQMMINSDRIPEGDKEIDRMQVMAEQYATPLQMRASLSLSLAKVYQKRGQHDKAMGFADKANEITQSFLSFDPIKEAKHVDHIIARMSKAFFDSRENFGSRCDMPIFILGMPRSGTTLVEQIVGGHSEIFPGGELGLIPTMWQRLITWEKRLGSPFQQIPDCALELTQEQSARFADRVEAEYRELFSEESNAQYITDKLPHNFKNIGLIKLLYPKAKIIYCRRSAGGIALSNYFTDYKARHGGMGFAYDKKWIGSEIANCQRIMSHWIDVFGDDIHIVDYEQLVENPEPAVRTLFDYLALDWQPQVMDFSTLKRAVKTASVTQVRKPMYTSSKEKWLKYEKQLAPVFTALTNRVVEKPPIPLPSSELESGLFLQGMSLLQNAKSTEAEAVFTKILAVYPRHAAAMHMLGAAYSNQGKIMPAHKCMKRSIQLHPGNHTWYNNLAIILETMRNPDEAAEMRKKGGVIAKRGGFVLNKVN
jgi:tetratricopeptide (TPR) repeat protein